MFFYKFSTSFILSIQLNYSFHITVILESLPCLSKHLFIKLVSIHSRIFLANISLQISRKIIVLNIEASRKDLVNYVD